MPKSIAGPTAGRRTLKEDIGVQCVLISCFKGQCGGSLGILVTDHKMDSMAQKDRDKRKQVNVTVLYEPYCKDSSWFITKQLLPVYGQLRKNLIVEMVPFGRARMKVPQGSDTVTSFACRHGQAECHTSMIHACAINLCPDPDRHLPFIACTLRARKPEKYAAKCCTASKMEAAKVMGCASSQQGKILLRNLGLRTMSLKPAINYVPSVIIDGSFDKRYQKKLQKQFKETVCEHFKPPMPQPCVMKKRSGWFGR